MVSCFQPLIFSIKAVWFEQIIEFPEIAGYSVGGESGIKYFMVQMHYDNPLRTPSASCSLIWFERSHKLLFHHLDRTDSSGIRFYLGNERRQYDLGYLGLGTDASVTAIAIPPNVDHFIVDAYCPATATSVSIAPFPISQWTVFFCSAFLHQESQFFRHFHILIYKVE